MKSTDRKTARDALRKLGRRGDSRYRSDPVGLLAELALRQAGLWDQTHALARQDESPDYQELGRCVLALKHGYLVFHGGDKAPPRPDRKMPNLAIPNKGVVNVLVIDGDWPADRRPHTDGTLRMFLDGWFWVGEGDWGGKFELTRKGAHQVDVRAYEEPAGEGPDIVVRLSHRKYLSTPVEFTS